MLTHPLIFPGQLHTTLIPVPSVSVRGLVVEIVCGMTRFMPKHWCLVLMSLGTGTIQYVPHNVLCSSPALLSCRCSPRVRRTAGQIYQNRGGHSVLIWVCSYLQRHTSILQESRCHFLVSRCAHVTAMMSVHVPHVVVK